MTTTKFYNYVEEAFTIYAETCSGTRVMVTRTEARNWAYESRPRGRVRYNPITNRLWIGLQYWDGEPIEDPQPSPGPSGQQPES